MGEQFKREEEEVFELLNATRADPRILIPGLNEMKQYFKGKEYSNPKFSFNVMTEEGVAAIDEAIAFLEGQKPLPKLSHNANLDRSAHLVVEHIGLEGLHFPADPRFQLETRLREEVRQDGSMAENISFGWLKAFDILAQLVVDDGVRYRGHRQHLFSELFAKVGVAIGSHKLYNYCCVLDFLGQPANKEELFQKYEIERELWPKDPLSVSRHLEMKLREGALNVKVVYEFKLPDGAIAIEEKEFDEPVTT